MKETVYLETSVISYYTARPARDVVVLAHQEIPSKAVGDAVHIAIASIHEVEYLVTWNCSHIANGAIIKKLAEINTGYGVHTPVLCTPEELLE